MLLLLRSRSGFVFLSTFTRCCSKHQASATGLLRVIWNQLCEQQQRNSGRTTATVSGVTRINVMPDI